MIDALVTTLWNRSRFRRFLSVGIVGAIFDLSFSMSAVSLTGMSPELAKFIGAELAILVMFIVNDRWTFRDVDTRGYVHWVRRLLKSNLVRAGGLGLQVVVVYALVRTGVSIHVAGSDVWPALTMPIAIACAFLVNYVGETLLTWRAYR